jgi:hypothetical protein
MGSVRSKPTYQPGDTNSLSSGTYLLSVLSDVQDSMCSLGSRDGDHHPR